MSPEKLKKAAAPSQPDAGAMAQELPTAIKEPERLTTPDGRLLAEAPAVADVGRSSDAGATAEADKLLNDAAKEADVYQFPHHNVLAKAIATALTRREAAGFARGVSEMVEIAEGYQPVDGSGHVGGCCDTALQIASAGRALLGRKE